MSQVYFSPSSTTFFRADTHGVPGSESCKMPSDVVAVSQSVFETMSEARSLGMRLVADEDGQPTAIPRLAPTAAELAENERLWRDREIRNTEWLVARHRDEIDMAKVPTIAIERFGDLLDYRQLLRDWPSAVGFPKASKRPQAPDWLAAALSAE
ncbi:phage tail assembly chaperone [Pseudomonas shahriarae]|uniref:phage tail assembly chaperone n=1 Tax=Pseudomonas shahriarae TaxID=2745512 RepID=UPI0021C5F6C5|nr:phage tail assembly chaperone [Pseudomonas shahriarae]MCU0213334.1 phage tail assembly chaperone [Pseudomonas shahriarae]